MKRKALLILLLSLLIFEGLQAQVTMIPMDETQTDHLKAYGIAFKALQMGK